jgi:hypothetical protein
MRRLKSQIQAEKEKKRNQMIIGIVVLVQQPHIGVLNL